MHADSSPLILTRRALVLAGCGIAAWRPLDAAGSGEFWDKKEPSQWSSEEIARLTTKSPWAKEVSATVVPGEEGRGENQGGGYPNGGGYPGGGYPGGGYPGGGMGYPRGGMGRRGGMGGSRMPRSGGPATAPYKGTVRWESAKPILEAMKTPLPDAFANHYVISVSGIPLRDSRRTQGEEDNRDEQPKADENLDELKQFASLQPHGKELAQPGVVQRQANSYSTFLFGFSKDVLALTKKDWQVVFSARIGRYHVRTKFEPGQMTYHKQLAV
ncbi:MAG TPA: hypothetical protein VE959_16350 [Bryobacteraceae bacterium]|nr:hypothetical protein [Bryobacteraceae bacterium]